jgi:GrpB-like predicted nucleotidyltransferase (UPF0157 family)
MVDYAAAGLGLHYGTIRLVRADPGWSAIAEEVAATLRSALGGEAAAVEHIGSTAVAGLLAKPILDFAVGIVAGVAVSDVAEAISDLGWISRGDAGADGGWVFVLEDAPWYRVAHAHAVEHGGEQWRRYLQLRDMLRRSVVARRAYEQTKQRLVTECPNDREQYTSGKTGTVRRLLDGGAYK